VRIALELYLERDAGLLVPIALHGLHAMWLGSGKGPHRLAVSALDLPGNGETHSRLGPPYGW